MEQQSFVDQVKLIPSEILIFKSKQAKCSASITIVNNSEIRIGYKVKTSAPSMFIVDKPCGFLLTKSQKKLSVFFKGPIDSINQQYKFLIEYQNCPEGTEVDWANKSIQKLKLSVKFADASKGPIKIKRTSKSSKMYSLYSLCIEITQNDLIHFTDQSGLFPSKISILNSCNEPKSFKFTIDQPTLFLPSLYEGTISPSSKIDFTVKTLKNIDNCCKGLELFFLYSTNNDTQDNKVVISKSVLYFHTNIESLPKSSISISPLIQLSPNDVLIFRKKGEEFFSYLKIKNNSTIKILYRVLYSDEQKKLFDVFPLEQIINPKGRAFVRFKYFGCTSLEYERQNFLIDCYYVKNNGEICEDINSHIMWDLSLRFMNSEYVMKIGELEILDFIMK